MATSSSSTKHMAGVPDVDVIGTQWELQVSILRRYIDAAGLDHASCLPLFRSLTKKKAGHSLRQGKLSYTRYREIFKAALKDLGYNPKDYGLHCLRSSGITSVVANDTSKTVFERLSKPHVRWKTDAAKDIYVLEPEKNIEWLYR